MKLIRHILFSFVLLIILGHASMAHSHERSNALCQLQSPAEHGLFELLKKVVSSDTGKHHLEDYKPCKEAFLSTPLVYCMVGLVLEQIVLNPPLNPLDERFMHPASVWISFYYLGTTYTLRGSPYLA